MADKNPTQALYRKRNRARPESYYTDPEPTKRCSKCKEAKQRCSNFHRRGSEKDGFNNVCKGCVRTYSRSYYEKNIKTIKQHSKAYYQRNKAKQKVKQKVYSKVYRNRSASYSSYAAKIRPYISGIKEGPDGELLVPCLICGKLHGITNSKASYFLACMKGHSRGLGNFYCSEKCRDYGLSGVPESTKLRLIYETERGEMAIRGDTEDDISYWIL